MTVPFWCLFVTALLPYILSWIGGVYRVKQFDTYDNRNPRVQAAALQGVGARVMAAQQNSWEALPFFASAVFVAHLAGADPEKSALAALLFVASRILYSVAYIADRDAIRSLVFIVGLGCCIWLFVLAGLA